MFDGVQEAYEYCERPCRAVAAIGIESFTSMEW
jgi:hypothetical protein